MGDFCKGWRRKLGVGTLLLACLVIATMNKTKLMSLPVISPWEPTSCKLLDADAKELVQVSGRRIVYGPNDTSGNAVPIPVTAFVTSSGAWVGPECDMYLRQQDGIVGLKVDFGGISWFAGVCEGCREADTRTGYQ